MGTDFVSLLRFGARLIAVVVLAVVVGYGLGYGLSEAKGDGDVQAPPPFMATADATGATGTSGTTGAPVLRVRVLSSTIEKATTASGQSRRRARVTVRLTASASGGAASLGPVQLLSGSESVDFDPNARDVAGGLLRPVPAGKSTTGELHFETAGALTSRLTSSKRATLRFRGRMLPLTLAAP